MWIFSVGTVEGLIKLNLDCQLFINGVRRTRVTKGTHVASSKQQSLVPLSSRWRIPSRLYSSTSNGSLYYVKGMFVHVKGTLFRSVVYINL